MNSALYNELYELRRLFKSDERVHRLEELDQKLNENEEIMKFSYQKEMAIVEYEDALKHFGKNSLEVQKAQQKLAKSKLELDNHPLVKEYYLALRDVREMDRQINQKLFDDFQGKGEQK